MKKSTVVSAVINMVFFCSCIMIFSGSAAGKTIDLKFSSPWPPNHPQHTMVITPWAEKLKELSGNRVKVTLFPGQALGKTADQYDMAAKGICDIALAIPNYTPGRFHLLSAFWLPFMVTTAEDTSAALWKTYDKYFQDEFKEVKVLWLYVHAAGQLFTREKQIQSLEDLKGMKIRATSVYIQDSLKLLGASPVAIPVPDVYNALERGVVDGTAMPYEGMWVFKQYEVVKYGTICNLYTMTFPIVMNKRKFESLPEDIQKIINDTTGLMISKKAGMVYDKTEEKMRKLVLENGVTENNLPASDLALWKLKGKEIKEAWIKEREKEGYPGAEVIDYIEGLLGIK
jgi:TRAP-type C4-dicarboxylate transport system substrate-binding protein